jgi:hypothetical protein
MTSGQESSPVSRITKHTMRNRHQAAYVQATRQRVRLFSFIVSRQECDIIADVEENDVSRSYGVILYVNVPRL